MAARFDYGDTLHLQIRALHLPEPVREFRFHPPRRWRFDLCWPDRLLFVECDGGTYGNARLGHGGSNDCEKANTAVLDGWTPLRFSGPMIKSGEAIHMLEQVFAGLGPARGAGGEPGRRATDQR